MSNIEKLKQELLTQKQNIEKLGGNVVVANTNPSPAEISQGILTIDVPDLTVSTATEEDVLYGKTFFSGNSTLKIGTYSDSSTTAAALYEYEMEVQDLSLPLNYNLPTNITKLRPYMYYKNHNAVNFHFHPGLTELNSYTFSNANNFSFYGLEDLTLLTSIPENCFEKVNPNGIDLSNLPPNITQIVTRSFSNSIRDNCVITIPKTVTTLASYAFYSSSKKFCLALNIPTDAALKSLGTCALENLFFNCDLTTPPNVEMIPTKFAYNGSFNNIIFSKKIASLYANCFGAASTTPLSEIALKTVTFLKTTPPSVYYTTVFPTQAKENGLKIYVPDESIEAYKNKLTDCVDLIYPASQKE